MFLSRPIALLVLGLLALLPSTALGLVSTHADVNQERRTYHQFRLNAETQLAVSARCVSHGNASHYRVWIERRTPQGTWRQGEPLVQARDSSEGQTTITLPEGHYRVVISARRMEYWFSLNPSRG